MAPKTLQTIFRDSKEHRGPKDQKKSRFRARLKISREWNFRASHPPRPYFLWGDRDVEIEMFEQDWKFLGCLEKGWNRQGVRLQYLAAATTLETCLEHPFTQPIADKLLHSKQQKLCNSCSTIASYCVAWTIARTVATANNYCSDTPCGIHPFSEHPNFDRDWKFRARLNFFDRWALWERPGTCVFGCVAFSCSPLNSLPPP